MSKVIDSFLVALGFEVDAKSNQQANTAISGLKTNAIQLGVAISGALLSGGYIAKSTAAEIDKISNSAKLLSNVSAGQLDQLRNAYSLVGGSADQADADLENLESKLAALRTGDQGLYNQLGLFDIPVEFLQRAENSLELLREIAMLMPTLSEDQRPYFGKAMGLSDGGRLLVQEGPGQYQGYLNRAAELVQLDAEMTESARGLTNSFSELGLSIDNILRHFTKGAAPGMESTVDSWIESLMGVPKWAEKAGDWFGDGFKSLNTREGSPLSFLARYGTPLGAVEGLKRSLHVDPVSYIQRVHTSAPTSVHTSAPTSVLAGEGKVIRTINDHRKFDIHVHGSTDAKAVADEVMKKVSSESTKIAEETRTGVAG